jgi:hypothetical protein
MEYGGYEEVVELVLCLLWREKYQNRRAALQAGYWLAAASLRALRLARQHQMNRSCTHEKSITSTRSPIRCPSSSSIIHCWIRVANASIELPAILYPLPLEPLSCGFSLLHNPKRYAAPGRTEAGHHVQMLARHRHETCMKPRSGPCLCMVLLVLRVDAIVTCTLSSLSQLWTTAR